MTPAEPTPIDDQLLAALLAEEAALAEGGAPPPDDPDGSRQGLRECLRLLRTLGPDAESGPKPSGSGDALKFGRFVILGEVGRGGFGIVYRAHDPVLGREVALKVPRPELIASAEVRRRFLREARAAAGLEHPNLVPVHEVGPLGPVCYIASAYCPGPTLARWLKERAEPVPPKLGARLVADLAGAVQHAHEHGVLHRDIKPSNVILSPGRMDIAQGLPDGSLTPRLTDFGLAKLAEEGGDETRTLAVLGSPPYMAPEQADGRNAEVGPATDVHALGAILYEILVALPPFLGESRSETLRRVIESEPIAPRTLRPRLPRDLETIVLNCLAKDPSRRYGSAAALREDLERFLDGEPIRARPPPFARRAWARVRRHPTLAVSASVVLLAIAGLISILVWSNARQLHSIARLVAEKSRADSNALEADRQRRLAERHLHGAQLWLAGQALNDGQFERAQDILHDLEPSPGEVEQQGFAWRSLWRRACREGAPMYGHDRDINAMLIAPDGRTLVSGDEGGTIRLWDLATSRSIGSLEGHTASLWAFAFTADGRFLVSLARSVMEPRSEVWVWELATHRVVAKLGGLDRWVVDALGFEPGDTSLWVHVYSETSPEAEVLRYDLTPDPSLPSSGTSGRSPHQIHVISDGRIVTVVTDEAAEDDCWSVRDAKTGRVDWVMYGLHIMHVPFAATADSRLVAAAIPGGAVVCRDSRTGAEVARLVADARVFKLAFSPDGHTLAAGCDSGVVRLWDLSTGRALRLPVSDSSRPDPIFSLAFAPDGSKLAVSEWAIPGGSTPITVWEVATGQRLREYPGRRDRVAGLRFTHDGQSLLIASGTTLRRWRLERGTEPDAPSGHADEAWAVAFRPDGRVVASGSDDTTEPHTIKLWDPATGHLLRSWSGGRGTVASLAFTPDGRVLASGHLEATDNVRLWEAATGRLLATLSGHTGQVRSVAFHPDGALLASAGSDRTVRLWDVATRRCVRSLTGHTMTVQGLAFSPDGRALVSASADRSVRLWDVTTGRRLRIFQGPEKFTAVAFTPDGGAIAAADEDGTITLWAPATGDRLRVIRGEDGVLRSVAFTPDGRALAAAGEGGAIAVWDAVTGQQLLTLSGPSHLIHALAFSPDGRMLASCDHGGAIRLWREP